MNIKRKICKSFIKTFQKSPIRNDPTYDIMNEFFKRQDNYIKELFKGLREENTRLINSFKQLMVAQMNHNTQLIKEMKDLMKIFLNTQGNH